MKNISRIVGIAVLMTLALASLTACGGSASAPGDIEGFIVEDASSMLTMNVRGLLEASEAPFETGSRFGFTSEADDFEEALEDWQDEWEDSEVSLGTALDDVTEIMMVDAGNINYFAVRGVFEFSDIRYELDDQDFKEDTYRDMEIWEGDYFHVALFDSSGVYVWGDEDSVKEVIKAIDREEGFADSTNNDLIAVRNNSGKGLIFIGDNSCLDGFGIYARAVENCESFGIAITGGNDDEVELSGAMKFSSERRAESGKDDFEDMVEDDDNLDADINEIKVVGEFVTFKVTIYE